MTNEARLKTAIDYLESKVKGDDTFIVDSFEKDFSGIDFSYQDDIIEEIISQLSKPHHDGYVDIGGEDRDDDEYGVNADYGVFNEMWFIEILVWNYTKNKFEVNITVRIEWDDDEPVEYEEHQQYLKKITENFLSIIGLSIDKRLGSLYFLKMDWKTILKVGRMSEISRRLVDKVIDETPRSINEILDLMYDKAKEIKDDRLETYNRNRSGKSSIPTRGELRMYLSKNYNSIKVSKRTGKEVGSKSGIGEMRYFR
tara:strand:+ start:343 stop:1107 length:765 start_codon:yes stop_codon:yes gene_type:complete